MHTEGKKTCKRERDEKMTPREAIHSRTQHLRYVRSGALLQGVLGTNVCATQASVSQRRWHTQRLLLLLLGCSAYKSSRSSVFRNQALLRHGVGIVTKLRAGRPVVRIPTAEGNFSLFPTVQTGSRVFRDFANAPKKRWRPRPFYKCGTYSNLPLMPGDFIKSNIFSYIYIYLFIYETTWLHLLDTVLKRLAAPPSCPRPYYMTILFPSGNNACMKKKYKRSNWERNDAEG
jgi:hypothetical protein